MRVLRIPYLSKRIFIEDEDAVVGHIGIEAEESGRKRRRRVRRRDCTI
jgi:hypothetical protein